MNSMPVTSKESLEKQGYRLTIQVLAMPADTNQAGDIFGGWLMSQIDIAGSIIACERARGRIGTVAVNSLQFIKPMYVGDLLSCYAMLEHSGNTSLRVSVKAYVYRSRDPGKRVQVGDAVLTYVALDEDGNKRSLPEYRLAAAD